MHNFEKKLVQTNKSQKWKALLILSFIYFNVLWTRSKTSSQINGEGKVKVIPDQATITVSWNQRNNAKDVKKQNDEKIDRS
jgi:uncharacterized protein YggE